jgi:predicted Zn-dependent protease
VAAASEDPEKPEVILTTEYEDRKVGAEAAEEIEANLGLVDAPELSAYVARIGQRAVREAPLRDFDYRFQIVDQNAPNAFALPGGFVFISRGLLVLANSEDQLANVICHEIVHVAARHAAARQSVIHRLPGPLRFFAMKQIASYSRDQEREADRQGQELCAASGFDPEGMADFLHDLEYTERLQLGATRLPHFLDTHPETGERVAAAATRARMATWKRKPGIARNRAEFLRRIEGLTIGTSGAEGVFQGDRFLHPELGFSMRFPAGWETRNTHTAVGAISPDRRGQVFLQFSGEGDDPKRASETYLADPVNRALSVKRAAPVKLGSLPAWRIFAHTSTPSGGVDVVLTWIARDGSVYLLTGVAAGRSRKNYDGIYLNVARSFRPLTPRQRGSIRETRLRIATALEGESLKQISARTGNVWNLQETAVMNGVFANAVLSEGQLVKVAVSFPYHDPEAAHSPASPPGGAVGRAARHSTKKGLDQAAPPSS